MLIIVLFKTYKALPCNQVVFCFTNNSTKNISFSFSVVWKIMRQHFDNVVKQYFLTYNSLLKISYKKEHYS